MHGQGWCRKPKGNVQAIVAAGPISLSCYAVLCKKKQVKPFWGAKEVCANLETENDTAWNILNDVTVQCTRTHGLCTIMVSRFCHV